MICGPAGTADGPGHRNGTCPGHRNRSVLATATGGLPARRTFSPPRACGEGKCLTVPRPLPGAARSPPGRRTRGRPHRTSGRRASPPRPTPPGPARGATATGRPPRADPSQGKPPPGQPAPGWRHGLAGTVRPPSWVFFYTPIGRPLSLLTTRRADDRRRGSRPARDARQAGPAAARGSPSNPPTPPTCPGWPSRSRLLRR